MRIMLDTNILISMFLFPSKTMNKLKFCLCMHHEILLCSYVVEEMKDVISRKFKSYENKSEEFFQTFPFDLVYTPESFNKDDYPEVRDIFDLPILVSAILENADILISGDKDLTTIEIERPEILTPTEFLDRYDNNSN